MSERPRAPESAHGVETVEQKKERLRPAFLRSHEVFRDPERPLRDGALTVEIEQAGERRTVTELVAIDVGEDAVELGVIDEDGEIGPSGFLAWDEIVDVR